MSYVLRVLARPTEASLDVISPLLAKKLALIFIFFLGFLFTFLGFYSRPTSRRLLQKMKLEGVAHDPRYVRQELATRAVAILHAIIITYVSAYALIYDEKLRIDLRQGLPSFESRNFHTESESFAVWCCFSVAYFVGDLITCTVLFHENGLQFFIHALVGLAGTGYGAFSCGHIYVAILFLWEASTPFLHFRWLLLEYGYKDTPIYILNGLILVVTFIFFRILIGIPLCMRLVYELWFREGLEPIGMGEKVTFAITSVASAILNLTWGYVLVSKALKSARGGGSTSKGVEKKTE